MSESLIEKKDSTNASILKEISSELFQERISLLKSSVKKYGKLPSGAVLPTLCTIQDRLTKNDILEMYNYLSPEMKNSYLGKETLKIAESK